MTPLDWAIAAFTFLLAVWGYRQGLIVGAVTLGGFAVGAALGSRLAPLVLEQGSSSPYAPMMAAVGAIGFGVLAVGLIEGSAARLRGALVRGPTGHFLDGMGGAALIGCVALALVWVFGAAVLHAPGAEGLRRDVQRSLLLSGINDVLPPSGPLIQALHRIDPVPQFASSPGEIAPPGSGTTARPEVRDAAGSVVKLTGTACGLGVVGSGWVAAPGLIVTNAHVVAGQSDTVARSNDGQVSDAETVFYSPENDLAIVTASLDLPALSFAAETPPGKPAAVVGYPDDGPLTATPARLGETREVVGEDAYGSGPITRSVVALRGQVRHGNSGGPILNGRGRVLGTVFAATTEGPRGGLAVPNDLVREALSRAGSGVSTGPCTQ